MEVSEMNAQSPEGSPARERANVPRWASYAGRTALVLIILAMAGGIATYWLMNRPKAERKQPLAQATLVEVAKVKRGPQRVVVRAMGTAVPSQSIKLSARVSGEVTDISPRFVPGGRFAAGERILQIDPKDYELAVKQRESELAKIQSDLRLEMGQQSVAESEYELLGHQVNQEDEELLLRKPQLAAARAAVSAAQAAYEQAKLDLKRTEVTAPFNMIVLSRNADLGSQVSAGAELASVVGTDEYWVQVSIPVDQLKWIEIPGVGRSEGSPVQVLHETASGGGQSWEGEVARMMPNLEPQGRMAQVLVSVKDPLGLQKPLSERQPLILDSFVRVEIEGTQLDDVVRIERTSLRDGRDVWVMQPDGKLDIRKVAIAWSGNDHVYVSSGLADGDRLVITDIAAPVKGMALRTSQSASAKSAERTSGRQQVSEQRED